MSKSSGLMWHEVPNRGRRGTISLFDRNHGDISLSSGWQGDNSGSTAQDSTTNDHAVVPVAKNLDGSSITGFVLGRIFNRSEFIHLGFNGDEAGRQVYDGAYPRIAGRKIVMNVRFATADQHLMLDSGGMEGPTWYGKFPDDARDLPSAGILDRCDRTKTCPKILEVFGASEFWYLHMSPGLVGTRANADIPLPANVRRYYIPGTPHGGGSGGFSVTPLGIPTGPGSGITWGPCTFAGNSMPYAETEHALITQFREWVMNGTPMVPSRYPTLRNKTLVAPTKGDMGVCSTSHPLSRQVLKLIFGADDEQLRFPRCRGGASGLSNERRRGAVDNRLRVHARQIDLIER